MRLLRFTGQRVRQILQKWSCRVIMSRWFATSATLLRWSRVRGLTFVKVAGKYLPTLLRTNPEKVAHFHTNTELSLLDLSLVFLSKRRGQLYSDFCVWHGDFTKMT